MEIGDDFSELFGYILSLIHIYLLDKNLFNQQSSGIGLSLVKELVELHKATIRVDSKEGEGLSLIHIYLGTA